MGTQRQWNFTASCRVPRNQLNPETARTIQHPLYAAEKCILGGLVNHTSYKRAIRLAHEGKDYDDNAVERSAVKVCFVV